MTVLLMQDACSAFNFAASPRCVQGTFRCLPESTWRTIKKIILPKCREEFWQNEAKSPNSKIRFWQNEAKFSHVFKTSAASRGLLSGLFGSYQG